MKITKWLAVLSLASFCCTALANPVTLRYDAFVGMAHAGEITIELRRDERTYAVRGDARSRGLMELLKDTRGWFAARGRIELGEPQLDVYEYYQKDNSKERFISVSGGEVTYVKNGRARPPSPAHTGTDLVTALWVVQDCASLGDVHTGRRGYRFALQNDADGVCQFTVAEDDSSEEPFDLDVEYGQRHGVRVPISIRSGGVWPGELRLVD